MSIELTRAEAFAAHYRARMRPDLKLFACGEANFRKRWIKRWGADPVSCACGAFLAAMQRQTLDSLVTANIGSRFTFEV